MQNLYTKLWKKYIHIYVHFVDIGGIDYHHCLEFLFILYIFKNIQVKYNFLLNLFLFFFLLSLKY